MGIAIQEVQGGHHHSGGCRVGIATQEVQDGRHYSGGYRVGYTILEGAGLASPFGIAGSVLPFRGCRVGIAIGCSRYLGHLSPLT